MTNRITARLIGEKDRGPLICDGAFGTYYRKLYPDNGTPELANLEHAERIAAIHREYIDAGADLIRTNTFGLSAMWSDYPDEEFSHISEIQSAAVHAARSAIPSAQEVIIAGNIGPVSRRKSQKEDSGERSSDIYVRQAEHFIREGVDVIWFESFSSVESVIRSIQRIRETFDGHIQVQLSSDPYGFTEDGLPVTALIDRLALEAAVDGVGLNCGIAPGLMMNVLKRVHRPKDKVFSLIPNAGFPAFSRDEAATRENIVFFAQKLSEALPMGVSIFGGCCGTTPEYILALSMLLQSRYASDSQRSQMNGSDARSVINHSVVSHSYDKKPPKTFLKKIIAVELAPPFNADISRLMDAAADYKRIGVDMITFPDSPSGRTRVDSIATAIKVFREFGIESVPHICCRDKNSIGLSAQLLGAHVNDLRRFLVVTGDKVPVDLRHKTQAVFDFDSVGMMQVMSEMNRNEFSSDPIVYGGAVNCGCRNIEVEIRRVLRKVEAGASFFISQPIFGTREIENLRRIKSETGAQILCGLMLLVSKKNAQFIKNEVSGIPVTDSIISRFDQISDPTDKAAEEKLGVSMCKDVMEKTMNFVDGYYFSIPFFRSYLLQDVLEGLNLNGESLRIENDI